MDIDEARNLAQRHIDRWDNVVLAGTAEERPFGFFFPIRLRKKDPWGMGVIGQQGVLVERVTGEVHDIGTGLDIDYWFEEIERGLNKPQDVTVIQVYHRRRAAKALHRLNMVHAHEVGGSRELYHLEELRQIIEDLPARFENQSLHARLNEIKQIEAGRDVDIILEPCRAE